MTARRQCCHGLHVAGVLRHVCHDLWWQQVKPPLRRVS